VLVWQSEPLVRDLEVTGPVTVTLWVSSDAPDTDVTAKLIDAAEAARLGLVNRVVPADQLMPWALETSELIASHSPSAVQAVKQQISTTIAEHAQSREALDQALGDRVRASAHFKEGVAAFLAKRPPNYR